MRMVKIKREMLFLSFFFLCISCSPFNVIQSGVQQVDSCNFHMSQYGIGLKWDHLPVPISLHKASMDKISIQSVIKVVDEMNASWNQFSGRSEGLFEVLGLIDYNKALEVSGDGQNTITFISTEENRVSTSTSASSRSYESKFLQSDRQAVTQVKGSRSFIEADIFVNDDNFDFYYEDNSYITDKNITDKNPRNLASFDDVKVSFFSKIKDIFFKVFDFLMFWKEKKKDRSIASRYKRIPIDKVDFESLIVHELGHVVGLGHNEEEGSVMKRKLSKGRIRRGLSSVDLNSLFCGYGEASNLRNF